MEKSLRHLGVEAARIVDSEFGVRRRRDEAAHTRTLTLKWLQCANDQNVLPQLS